GYKIYLDPAVDPTTDAYNKGINTEHSWPQSKGAASGNARSDMHHLYPAKDNVNSSRGNSPFDEISDNDTDNWYRNEETLNSIPTQYIDEYSEKDNDVTDGRFESREDHKGNLARSMFYFYTMYKTEADAADSDFFPLQKEVLLSWHKLDIVDAAEVSRTNSIAAYQENLENPFILDTTLIRRAYFSGTTNNPPSNITFSNVEETSFTITWSLPGEYQADVNEILVLMQQGSGVDDDPTGTDISTYNADSRFGNGDEIGSGSYVVYRGDGSSVNVTNLTADATYYIKIWNTINGNEYSETPAEANQQATPTVPVGSGDIIISEIMQNPSAVYDDVGEWFEIHNTTSGSI
ncbi:MAG: endonuclease, partial [Calditrichia bacterium]|nr:endonuclease [Calditrichia bacterium]